MSHTPGPWKVSNHSGADNEIDIEQESAGWFLRLSPGYEFTAFDDPELVEKEFKANARLIAAAPELLEACEEFVRKVECGEARSKRSYKQMTAAILKARHGQLQSKT